MKLAARTARLALQLNGEITISSLGGLARAKCNAIIYPDANNKTGNVSTQRRARKARHALFVAAHSTTPPLRLPRRLRHSAPSKLMGSGTHVTPSSPITPSFQSAQEKRTLRYRAFRFPVSFVVENSAFRRVSVPSSSAPMSLLSPTTPAARIAASLLRIGAVMLAKRGLDLAGRGGQRKRATSSASLVTEPSQTLRHLLLQPIPFRQCRKPAHPEYCHQQCPQSADHHRADRAEQRRRGPGLEFAQLV